MLVPVLDAAAMRAADHAAIDDWGVPVGVLMETAGRAVADAAERLLGSLAGRRVTVLAGTGNNGGDGLVAARVLHARGADVRVIALGDGATDDARGANLVWLRRLAGASDTLRVDAFESVRQLASAAPPSLVVDALLGTGATGALREPVATLAAWANRQTAPVVAADVPSGLDATTGAAPDDAIRATATVALGALKSGLLVGRGPTLAGRVTVAEIGIPPMEIEARAVAHQATDAWIAAHLPVRALDAHKYTAGRALCIVGSRAYSGAAVLSAGAAARSAAGAVVCATTASAAATVDAHLAEVMADALPETDAGTLAVRGYDRLAERIDAADAVLVGCGLGRAPETSRLVTALLRRLASTATPAVLDADALRAIDAGRLAERSGENAPSPLVLTPHLGELRAMVGDDAYDPADRIAAVRELAVRWRATVVLKGMPSLVGTPDGRVVVGPPPEPALATAGAGDVLAGTITGLMAQGLAPDVATVVALHVGSAAVRVVARRQGTDGLVAPDLVAALPRAIRRLRRAR